MNCFFLLRVCLEWLYTRVYDTGCVLVGGRFILEVVLAMPGILSLHLNMDIEDVRLVLEK